MLLFSFPVDLWLVGLENAAKEEKKRPIYKPKVMSGLPPSSPVGFYTEKGDKQIKQLKTRTKR